jgi:hypothetical protein
MRDRASSRRIGVASVVALGAVVAFAAIGGTGLAGSLAKPGKSQYAPGQYQYSEKKVTVCHKGKVTIRISVNALPAHKQHGDTLGLCPALAAAKAKAAAAAAAARTSGKGNGKGKGQSADTTSSASSGPGKGNGNGKGNGKK